MVWGDSDAGDTFCDTGSSDLGFRFAYVGWAEEELAVEIRDVNGVHINHIDIAKARESKIFEEFAA